MNNIRTIDLIRKRFVNLTYSTTDIVRAERHHDGRPMGVFYFDFSQAVAAKDFELKPYLLEQIASDFYKHEGPLQWNYYLYFVFDLPVLLQLRDTRRAKEIENDRTFARKFLRDTETLESELSRPLASVLGAVAPAQDVASRWVQELKAARLERIADPTADYAPIVRAYLGGTAANAASSTPAPILPITDGRFIRTLELDSFRAHPTEKSFEFGTVNLIRGVNGTGKTSLLEAIELCICGGIRRQGGNRPSGARIYVEFEGASQPQKCPESTAANYRARDRAWYGGYYLQGNRLFDNFSRFNFFDSDAAYALSEATSGAEIVGALMSLLLGDYANTIEERMVQCKERFLREQREAAKLLEVRRKELRKAKGELKEIQGIKDTREALATELKEKAAACGWRKLPANLKMDDLALLEEAVAELSEEFVEHVDQIPWLAEVSLLTLRAEAVQLSDLLKDLAKFNAAVVKVVAASDKTRARIQELEAKVELVGRIDQYYRVPQAMSLIGAGQAIKDARGRIASYKQAIGLLQGVNLKEFEQAGETLEDLLTQRTSEIASQRRHLSKLSSRASELQKKLGAIKSLVEEIRGLGMRFCQVDTQSRTCPLCGSAHEDLSQRITAQSGESSTNTTLGDLTKEIARQQSILDEALNACTSLARVKDAAQLLLTESDLFKRSTRSVIQELSGVAEKLTAEDAIAHTLVVQVARLGDNGFTEGELLELLNDADESFNVGRSKLEKSDSVRALLTESIKELDELKGKVKEYEKHKKEHLEAIQQLLGKRFGAKNEKQPEVELVRRKASVEEVLSTARSAKDRITLSESDAFPTIRTRLIAFAKAVRRTHDALQRVEEKDALEHRLVANVEEAQREISRLEPTHTRAASAVGVLEKLLGSEYKAAYLEQFLGDHKQRLTTIFSRIHAPHEFNAVHLGEEMALERNTGEKSPISEISTGQRAALALSIFLSLNSSVTAHAPWLLFDDPVAHVDDINVLSFFDMLRDLVVLGKRQVFFATANAHIADLFGKKFSFLQEEFKTIRLDR